MSDKFENRRTDESFVPPVLDPQKPVRWKIGGFLDETAMEEIRIFRDAMQLARDNPKSVMGYTPLDE